MLNIKNGTMANNSNYVQKGNEVNKVYQTRNLSMFKEIQGNRVPNLQHVNRLTESIKEYGMKCNPILVNEHMQVIDGQHRLLAAKNAESFIYYIVINGYSLQEVHTLNLNQKNWTKKDFMIGYADMGVKSYVKLRDFYNDNKDFGFSNCVALCSNRAGAQNSDLSQSIRGGKKINMTEIFESGTWKGKDFNLAQVYANQIRMIKPYYSGYNRHTFVRTMIGMFLNKNFNYFEFMKKLKLQPTALQDCANAGQFKMMIEDIYNYRNRNKVNLRYS